MCLLQGKVARPAMDRARGTLALPAPRLLGISMAAQTGTAFGSPILPVGLLPAAEPATAQADPGTSEGLEEVTDAYVGRHAILKQALPDIQVGVALSCTACTRMSAAKSCFCSAVGLFDIPAAQCCNCLGGRC